MLTGSQIRAARALLNWNASDVAEKVGVTETAAEFLHGKAEGAQPSDLLVFLDRAADEAPSPEDAL